MGLRLRATPWRDWSEWRQVYTALFSSSAAARDHACHRIAVWDARPEPLPVAVATSAALIRVQRAHHTTTYPLRLQYSMILLRLVNGILDTLQAGARPTSIAELAPSVALPEELVQLRHEATHGRLPQLPVLEFAATRASAWLRSHYWDRQAAHLASFYSIQADGALGTLLLQWQRRPAGAVEAQVALLALDGAPLAATLWNLWIEHPTKTLQQWGPLIHALDTRLAQGLGRRGPVLVPWLLTLAAPRVERAEWCRTLLALGWDTETAWITWTPASFGALVASWVDQGVAVCAPVAVAVARQCVTAGLHEHAARIRALVDEAPREETSLVTRIRRCDSWRPCVLGSVLGPDRDLTLQEDVVAVVEEEEDVPVPDAAASTGGCPFGHKAPAAAVTEVSPLSRATIL